MMIEMVVNEKESLILKLYPTISQALHSVSPTYLANRFYFKPRNKDDKVFVEGYVLFNTFLSIIMFMSWPRLSYSCLSLLALVWGGFRIVEILTIQVNALLFDYYVKTRERLRASNRKSSDSQNKKKIEPYVIQGYTRITILLLHNFVEIVFWFSVLYLGFPSFFTSDSAPLSQISALTFSFYTMTTFGHIPQVQIYSCGKILTLVQAATGLFMALLILSRFIGLMPRAPTSDPVEKEMEREERERDAAAQVSCSAQTDSFSA